MATMGVRGIWGLEKLERMQPSTGKLAATVMIGSVTISLLLMVLFLSGVPQNPGEAAAATLFPAVFSGFLLASCVALARWTQADIEGVLPASPEIEPSIGLLQPTRTLVLGCFLVMAVANSALMNLAAALGNHLALEDMQQFWTTPPAWFFGAVLPLIIALTEGPFLAVIIRQVVALTYAARHVDIDVLELDHYPRLANPLMRFIILTLVLLSFVPTALLIDDPGDRVGFLLVMPALTLILMLVIICFAYPVWVLRGRIRAAEEQELSFVFRSLRGDQQAMALSRIGDRAGSLGFSELLDYRVFIESLWDWPVAPHVQRIVLIGLLPPATWVLAALIQRAVTAVVG